MKFDLSWPLPHPRIGPAHGPNLRFLLIQTLSTIFLSILLTLCLGPITHRYMTSILFDAIAAKVATRWSVETAVSFFAREHVEYFSLSGSEVTDDSQQSSVNTDQRVVT